MGRYTVIPVNTFDALQLDAGVLLKNFNVEEAAAGNDGFANSDIICATTGGVNPSAVPTYSDLGEDIDNVPVNMKELMHLDSWAVSVATTGYGTSPETIARALGAADITPDPNGKGGKIVPRADLKQTDFGDIWWVGDKANGGFVAIRIFNALSIEGFSLQSSKNGKGTVPLTINGHVSINAQKVVPMEIYSYDGDNTSGLDLNTYTVTTSAATNGTVTTSRNTASSGDTITVTATPDTGYEVDTITWTPEGGTATDITTEKSFVMPKANVTVTVTFKVAAGTTTFTVTFESNGGDPVATQTVPEGGKATKPADPEYTGYTFGGWFEDYSTFLDEWDFDVDTVTGDITLYAKWD